MTEKKNAEKQYHTHIQTEGIYPSKHASVCNYEVIHLGNNLRFYSLKLEQTY